MRKKMLIELIFYIAVVIAAIFLLIYNKRDVKPIEIPFMNSTTVQEERNNAFVPDKQP